MTKISKKKTCFENKTNSCKIFIIKECFWLTYMGISMLESVTLIIRNKILLNGNWFQETFLQMKENHSQFFLLNSIHRILNEKRLLFNGLN